MIYIANLRKYSELEQKSIKNFRTSSLLSLSCFQTWAAKRVLPWQMCATGGTLRDDSE